jgi:hypothetical protein
MLSLCPTCWATEPGSPRPEKLLREGYQVCFKPDGGSVRCCFVSDENEIMTGSLDGSKVRQEDFSLFSEKGPSSLLAGWKGSQASSKSSAPVYAMEGGNLPAGLCGHPIPQRNGQLCPLWLFSPTPSQPGQRPMVILKGNGSRLWRSGWQEGRTRMYGQVCICVSGSASGAQSQTLPLPCSYYGDISSHSGHRIKDVHKDVQLLQSVTSGWQQQSFSSCFPFLG